MVARESVDRGGREIVLAKVEEAKGADELEDVVHGGAVGELGVMVVVRRRDASWRAVEGGGRHWRGR